jgi:hypothetical protein
MKNQQCQIRNQSQIENENFSKPRKELFIFISVKLVHQHVPLRMVLQVRSGGGRPTSCEGTVAADVGTDGEGGGRERGGGGNRETQVGGGGGKGKKGVRE